MNTVLVCGGRNFGRQWDETKMHFIRDEVECEFLRVTLTGEHKQRTFILLIHGAASGADTLAEYWAIDNALKVQAYPANWTQLGKSAGMIRNKQMLVEGKPSLVIAFKGGRGTKGMINIARQAGVEVLIPGWSYES